MGYYQNFVIGVLCCRVENYNATDNNYVPFKARSTVVDRNNNNANFASTEPTTRSRLYIMTLGVLAAYRGRGVGTKLIQSILDYFDIEKDGELSNVDEIALHVQISNSDAIHFYTKHFHFVKGEMVMNYYKRIDPP